MELMGSRGSIPASVSPIFCHPWQWGSQLKTVLGGTGMRGRVIRQEAGEVQLLPFPLVYLHLLK